MVKDIMSLQATIPWTELGPSLALPCGVAAMAKTQADAIAAAGKTPVKKSPKAKTAAKSKAMRTATKAKAKPKAKAKAKQASPSTSTRKSPRSASAKKKACPDQEELGSEAGAEAVWF